jgi:hypothetical protein
MYAGSCPNYYGCYNARPNCHCLSYCYLDARCCEATPHPPPPLPLPPPPSVHSTAEYAKCTQCLSSGKGYCSQSKSCQDPGTLSPCAGNGGHSTYIAHTYLAYNNLVGYSKQPLGWTCAEGWAPRPPPPSPSPSPSPPSPPSSPPPPPRPPPSPPPPPLPPQTCHDRCTQTAWASDGVCDDGGPGSEYALCTYGTDCTDCGTRATPSPPPAPPPSPAPSQPPLVPPPPFQPPIGTTSPPPPSAEVASSGIVVQGVVGTAATCAAGNGGGCTFGYSLALTPVLLSSSPVSANEGDNLTITAHSLSLTAANNAVFVGGRPCKVLTVVPDGNYTPPICPVVSCTQQMRTRTVLTCRVPHNVALGPHAVSISVAGAGVSPLLAEANVTTLPIIRAFSPAMGSVAGGTTLTLLGDGFSDQAGDLEVTVGGARCRILNASASEVQCTTSVAAILTSSSNVEVKLHVQGASAICGLLGAVCQYTYTRARTPLITSAAVERKGVDGWTIKLSGSFGSGNDVAPLV